MIRKEWNDDLQIAEEQPASLQYRSKWACFTCCTAFVRFSNRQQNIVCPTCRAIATDMGYLFKPPQKRDKKAWAIARLLAEHNVAYYRVGAVAFINAFITEYSSLPLKEVQKNLKLYLQHKKHIIKAGK